MPVFYWRHGDDDYHGPTHAHDNRLTYEGYIKSIKFAQKAIDRYGPPDIIYYSPMRRAYATMKGMVKMVEQPVEVELRNELSRYFCKREKESPDVAPRTQDIDIPIYETWNQFKHRCRQFIREMKDYYHSPKNVWVITHALVLKEVARYHRKTLPEHIPFLYILKIDRQALVRKHKKRVRTDKNKKRYGRRNHQPRYGTKYRPKHRPKHRKRHRCPYCQARV